MTKDQDQHLSTFGLQRALKLYCLAGAAQGLVAIFLLVGVRRLDGLSGVTPMRLLAAGLVALVSIVFLALAVLPHKKWLKNPSWLEQTNQRLKRQPFFIGLSILSGVIFIAGVYLTSAAPEIEEPFTHSLLLNLSPLLLWVSGLAAQSLLFLIVSKFKELRNSPKPGVFLISFGFLTMTLVGWTWVARVFLPAESQVRGWNSLGVPIMEMQLFIAWLISMIFLSALVILEQRPHNHQRWTHFRPSALDLIICILIWSAAVLVWQGIPTPASWFVTENRPPNFEPYPNSDAYYYDISAQTALVGEGFIFFDDHYIRRPLHATYLTWLHSIGGQDFSRVISLQLLVLAFFPVLVYLVGRKLHNQITGLLAALLILMREGSSIAISGNITSSHVKLLMVDIPAAMLVSFFVFNVLRWLYDHHENKLLAMLAGAALGASVLIRNETIIFVIPLGIYVLWKQLRDRKRCFWLQQAMLFAWGLFLVISPWVYRNYQLDGKIFLDSPIMRFDLIAQRYQNVEPSAPPQAPAPPTTQPDNDQPTNQTPEEPPVSQTPSSDQTPAENYVKTIAQQTLKFISSNPRNVASFILSHYTNSQLQTILVFPSTIRPLDALVSLSGHHRLSVFWEECCGMQNYTRRLPFWRKWDGLIPRQSTLPIIFNIFLLSWGFQTAWNKKKVASLVPLAFVFIYLAMNALFRNSGGRYILPVDWIMIIYFAMGLSDLSARLLQKMTGFKMPAILLDNKPAIQPPAKTSRLLRSPAFYSLTILLVLFGSLAPLTEKAFSQRYTSAYQDKLSARFFQSELLKPDQRATLKAFLNNGGELVSGRALYPRFFREFLGEPGSNNPFGPLPYPRIGFFLAGPEFSPVILPSLIKPTYLPHANDVLVIRCSVEETLAIAVFDQFQEVKAIYLRSPAPLNTSCPLAPQDITTQGK